MTNTKQINKQLNTMSQPSILWHDYETWGATPKYDKPSQFAGIRTDLDLNIISKPEVFYCQPPQDYLPQPEACLVTGITPQKAQKDGINEAEFAKRIHGLFSHPNTCVAGYNNIRFDDEVTRYLFFRNFYDPYAREWQHGNSRWDIIDLVRMCYAMRPEGIEWPLGDNGFPTFKLELLTKANAIEHSAAHDAMSDVYATIAMAKLIKDKQPKLYDFIFKLRNKKAVTELIDVYNMTPIVHTSSKISAEYGCTSWFAPVCYHPTNKNAVIAVNLAMDINPLLTLNADQIRQRLYTPNDELGDDESPIPLKLIHLNKCPMVAPAKTLTAENAERLNIPREQCLVQLQQLKNAVNIREVLSDVYAQQQEFEPESYVEHSLYGGGFISQSDRSQMEILHNLTPQQLINHQFSFADQRFDQLLVLFKARNYPHLLTSQEQQQWHSYCRDKLQHGGNGLLNLEQLAQKLEMLAQTHQDDDKKLAILKAVYHYVQSI